METRFWVAVHCALKNLLKILWVDCYCHLCSCHFIYSAWKRNSYRGALRTLSDIYDRAFLRIQLTAFSTELFSFKVLSLMFHIGLNRPLMYREKYLILQYRWQQSSSSPCSEIEVKFQMKKWSENYFSLHIEALKSFNFIFPLV